MADQSVKLQFFGSAAAAEKAIVQLEKKYDDLTNKLKQVSRESKRSTDQGTSGFMAMAGSVAKMAAGMVGVPALIGSMLSAQQSFRREAEQTAVAYDKMFRGFRVQAGLSEVQGAAAQKQIQAAATRNAVEVGFAKSAATQLVSSGFSVQDATGGALDTLLQGLAASNLTNADPTQLTQALGQFIESQGMEKNAANLQQVLVASQRLFKATDFQVSDLSQLAGKSAGFVGKLSVPEVMGTFDVLRNVMNADTASTAQKIFVERLTGAKGDKGRERELASLGLAPEMVDFQGENISTVLDRLATAFDKMDPTKRSGTLQRLFGTEASSAAEYLIRERGRLPKAIAAAADTEGFQTDVGIATSGVAAGAQRQKNMQEAIRAANGGRIEAMAKEMESMMIEQGISPARAADLAARYRGEGIFSPVIESTRALLGDQAAAYAATGATPAEYAEAQRRVDAAQQSAEKQVGILERIEANTRGRPNRNAQGE